MKIVTISFASAAAAFALSAAVPAGGSSSNPSWVGETPAAMNGTGTWSGDYQQIEEDEIALSGGNEFAPATPSDGRYVTFTMSARFEAAATAESGQETVDGAKSALRLFDGGDGTLTFQLLTSENDVQTWKNVTCGTTPALDTLYRFRFALDCSEKKYTVKLISGDTVVPMRSGDVEAFDFASASDTGNNAAVSSLAFVGDGKIAELLGSYQELLKEYFAVSSGSVVNVPVSWIAANMASTGIDGLSSDADAAAALAVSGANGLPKWQSYCLGLDPARADSVILCEAAQTAGGPGAIAVKVKNLSKPETLSGAAVTAHLDRQTQNGWELSVATTAVAPGETVLTYTPSNAGNLEIYRVRVTIE